MIKILFICHGNICRSPMGQYILQDMVNKAGRSADFEIDSAAVSREEIGNPVYPPARRELEKRGVPCGGHRARQVTMEDYRHFDRIYYMDASNARFLRRDFVNGLRKRTQDSLRHKRCENKERFGKYRRLLQYKRL